MPADPEFYMKDNDGLLALGSCDSDRVAAIRELQQQLRALIAALPPGLTPPSRTVLAPQERPVPEPRVEVKAVVVEPVEEKKTAKLGRGRRLRL